MKELVELNNKLIELNKNNSELLNKYQLIAKILSEDDCFFKMDIKTSYAILKDLGIKDDNIKEVYSNLIDINNY